MFGWFSKKSTPSSPPMLTEHPLRELLFGDQPLERWAREGAEEPWASFGTALARRRAGEAAGARRALEGVLSRPGLESRQYLQTWHALRELGAAPAASEAKRVLGVVVDVPTPGGPDTIAAYEDRSARLLSGGGGAVVWEHPDASVDGEVEALLAAGRALVTRIGPWAGPRPPLPPREARISLLTPSGLHFGQGPLEAFRRDPMAAPVLAAAAALQHALVAKANPQ